MKQADAFPFFQQTFKLLSNLHSMHIVRFSKTVFLQFSLATSIIVFGTTAQAQEPDVESCSSKPGVRALKNYPDVFNFYYENDMFTGTDHNYTSGAKFSWISANLEDYINDPCLPKWVRHLNQVSEKVQPGAFDSRNMVVSLGQAMYTPTDKMRSDLITDDRPYAGWLYLGLAYNARDDRHMDTVEIDIGMVGPASLARESQNFIHKVRGIDRFNGWSNQLNNELGIQFVKERKKRILQISHPGGPKIDAITHYGFSLGNVKTYANAGVEFRIGSYLPNDFGTSPIRPASDSNAPLPVNVSRRLSDGGVHAFVSVDGRAVARDIFLDGNTFSDSHSVSKRYFIGDVAAGVAWQWVGGKITYAHYLRSKEFRGQKDAQSYGSITLSLEY